MIKRDKYDALFSELVREAANWTCERCGKSFDYNHQGLQASHFFGRRYQGLRYHPPNVFAHCAACHFHFTDAPLEFTEWAKEHTDIDALRQRFRTPWKWLKGEKDEMRNHYKSELARIKQLRMDGVQGKINIEPYRRK